MTRSPRTTVAPRLVSVVPVVRPRPLVAFAQSQHPHSLDYPTVRVMRMVLDSGEADVLVLEERDSGLVAEGVEVVRGSVSTLARACLRRRPDLLVLGGPNRQLLLAPLARTTWLRAPRRAVRPLGKLGQDLAGCFIDVVSFQNPWQATLWPRLRARELDVPAPVDLDFWRRPVERDPAFWGARGLSTPTGPVLTSIANVVPGKRHDRLVAWCADFLRAHPDARLVLAGAGSDRAAMERLHREVLEQGLADRVLWVRHLDREDCRQLLAWSAAAVTATVAETQSMFVYEALAAGVPVVLPPVPSLTRTFPALPVASDPSSMSRQLDQIVDDRCHREAVVDACHDRVEWASVERHDRLVHELLAATVGIGA